MKTSRHIAFSCLLLTLAAAGQQQPASTSATAPARDTVAGTQQSQASAPPATQPQVDEWVSSFDGNTLDETRWEKFSFEGDPGVSVKVEKAQLHLRGTNNSRSGIRSKQTFSGDRYIVDAKLAHVGKRMPSPGSSDDTGFAIVTILFGGSERDRIEWILRSDGRLEAWLMRANEPSQELDNHKLGMKVPNPTLGIVRRGDDYLFLVNGQVGMQKNIPGMVKDFRVMVYGYGSSENDWESVRVVTPKQGS